ncbi:MAG: acyclic terpene utilization AtuA family protein [Spirochaetes bacterium]|nr:acyclic terpene utilization AtuA family protein [Spirochaetota bacterium]
MSERELRVLSPTAILGYGFPEESFRRGIAKKPHLVAADAGSTDPGPYYLGSGKSFTDRAFVKRDLAFMLREGLAIGAVVVVGSAGGSGAAPHLAWCRAIVEEIAREERLSFRFGVISTDVPKERVKAALRAGRIQPLAFVPALTEEAIDASTHLVAQAGNEPIQRALDAGCNVVLAGRCYDPACFAALPVHRGFDEGLALHMGKILECGAIAATPGSGADCAFATLYEDRFVLEALNPARKFTRESAAAHTLYEKSDPYRLPGPGGVIDLTACSFTEIGDGRVAVRGSRHERTVPYYVKLEGARRTGFRSISIAGTRDPIMIKGIDAILAAVSKQVESMSGGKTRGRVHFHVYGRDGVMGPTEPVKEIRSHELGIVIESVAPTQEEADTLTSVTRSTLLHYGYPGRISTAGNLAFPFSPSDIRAGEVYEFSVYHLMELDDPADFPLEVVDIKGGAR